MMSLEKGCRGHWAQASRTRVEGPLSGSQAEVHIFARRALPAVTRVCHRAGDLAGRTSPPGPSRVQ